MSWPVRLSLFAAGVFMIVCAASELRAGHWVFVNASYRQTTFAAAGFGVGAVLMLLAFLPPGDWVYKRITTRKSLSGPSRKTKR